jgi:hypothetical protein
MSQIVTKQSLNVLANLAFTSLQSTYDATPEPNLHGDAGESLFGLLRKERGIEPDDDFANGFTQGTEFGIAISAAIISNGFDSDAIREAVKSELQSAEQLWPESEPKAPALV